MRAFSYALSQLFFPAFCYSCKKFLTHRDFLCQRCQSLLKPIITHHIHVDKQYVVPVFAVSAYAEPLKKLILAKNWSDQLASIYMARLIWERTALSTAQCDYFVPVPLHWTRHAWRGYNQAEVMAQQLATLSGGSLAYIVRRRTRTMVQASLNIVERERNVRDVFEIIGEPQFITGKNIVIVDDLLTTGATIHAIAKKIAALKPARILVAVAARVI